MNAQITNPTSAEIFGEPIYSYTRAQALEDGELIDVTETAREVGFRYPTAVSAAVWADCVAWSDADTNATGWPQDQGARLWDVLFVAACAVRQKAAQSTTVTVPLSNGAGALVDADALPLVSGLTWHFNQGYAVNSTSVDGRPVTTFMHRLILCAPTGLQVDHINGNGLDNRRGNLRLVTASQNMMNEARRADNRSGHRGVSWEEQTGKWRVRIHAGGRDISVGRFATIEEAADAYAKAANRYHRQYALRNRQTDRVRFSLLRVQRDGADPRPREVALIAHIGPGDDAEPVITIGFPSDF